MTIHEIIENIIRNSSLLYEEELLALKKKKSWNIDPLEAAAFEMYSCNRWDNEDYLKRYEDVKKTGIDPFIHFIKFGHNEGRKLNRKFKESFVKDNWNSSISDEILFWESIINGTFPDKSWIDLFNRRIKYGESCPKKIYDKIKNSSVRLKILDVGAGPVSVLGNSIDNIQFELVAIDPLAESYNKLFEKYNIQPYQKTEYGEAEKLEKTLHDKFDVVFSRNALDHSYDPIKAFQSMVEIAAPHGLIYIEVSANEGLRQKYRGLHQWNMMPADNDLVIWNKNNKASLLSNALNSSIIQDYSVYGHGEKEWVTIEIVLK